MTNPPPTGIRETVACFIVEHERLMLIFAYLAGAVLWYGLGMKWWWYWPLHFAATAFEAAVRDAG